MSESIKLTAGSRFPAMNWAQTDGSRLNPAGMNGWRMLVVYRGAHCPLCKGYLKTLESLQGEYRSAGIAVAAVSADPEDRAKAEVAEEGWTFPVGYGLSRDDMQRLGLYISSPRSPQETDRDFAEPGVFAINPDGNLQIIDVSNAPFARPDLKALLKGLTFIQEKQYPVRGTA